MVCGGVNILVDAKVARIETTIDGVEKRVEAKIDGVEKWNRETAGWDGKEDGKNRKENR